MAACDLSQVGEKFARIKYPRLPLSQPCSLMPPLIAGCGGEEPEVQARLGGKELWFASWVRADPCPGARKEGDTKGTPEPLHDHAWGRTKVNGTQAIPSGRWCSTGSLDVPSGGHVRTVFRLPLTLHFLM